MKTEYTNHHHDEHIKLVRFARDCMANRNAEPGQKLIYDYEVRINGYLRAQWVRSTGSRGHVYQIWTQDSDPITRAPGTVSDYYANSAVEIKTQGEMLDMTIALLRDGRIPTALDIENRRQGEDRALAMAQERELADARKHAISKFALELYEEVVSEPSPDSFDRGADLIHRIHNEIARRQALTREHGHAFLDGGRHYQAYEIFREQV